MELADFVSQVSGFDGTSPRDRIQLFAWFLHTHKRKDTFNNADIRGCFSSLHIADPNVAKYLPRMEEYGDIMRVKGDFKLERKLRAQLDAKYGEHQTIVQVSRLLSELPGKVPDIAEQNFLTEVIRCYRVEAYRACVVMMWNLAYSHLLSWILIDAARLAEFNATITRRYPKKSGVQIVTYDDFLQELKESEVVEIGNTAGLINGSIVRILKEKLGKRNTAAHPASVVIVQSQADDVITDLVNNVVLRLS